MVHFLYGLLLVYPIREVVVRATGLRGFWSYFLPMDLTMSSSATYELIEWGAAVVFGGDLGVAYVGAQGDPWDAQKDMSLAALRRLAVHARGCRSPPMARPTPGPRQVAASAAACVEFAMSNGFLFGGYFLFWSALAIAPVDRQNWVLSSILPLALVGALVLGRRALPLSTVSYALVIGFLALHTIGAHYTYARVPMGLWLQHAFTLQRNHFDRITHFAFGLLFTYPLFEAFRLLLKDTPQPLAYHVTLMTQLGLAAVWEMIEAAVAQLTHPELGTAFVGSQGDIWDAQHDMLAATCGTIIALLIGAWLRWRARRPSEQRPPSASEVPRPRDSPQHRTVGSPAWLASAASFTPPISRRPRPRPSPRP